MSAEKRRSKVEKFLTLTESLALHGEQGLEKTRRFIKDLGKDQVKEYMKLLRQLTLERINEGRDSNRRAFQVELSQYTAVDLKSAMRGWIDQFNLARDTDIGWKNSTDDNSSEDKSSMEISDDSTDERKKKRRKHKITLKKDLKKQKVRHETDVPKVYPNICYGCGKYDHRFLACPARPKELPEKTWKNHCFRNSDALRVGGVMKMFDGTPIKVKTKMDGENRSKRMDKKND
jgi:hypothetical protein